LLIFSSNRSASKHLSRHENLATLCGYVVNNSSLPSQLQWTIEEVLAWIKQLGFPQYHNTFKANFIDGRKLLLVDASALVKMNIKDWDHILKITTEIREMYEIEPKKYDRSISLPLQNPETLFKYYKISSGPKYELCQQTDFMHKLKLMSKPKTQLNHFEKLHEWLKHVPEFQQIRIGNIKRANLFYVKPNPNGELKLDESEPTCSCGMPPCECNWSKKEQCKPWQLALLVELDDRKYAEKICKL
jgi:SAM domain (Sterile alpha motif)